MTSVKYNIKTKKNDDIINFDDEEKKYEVIADEYELHRLFFLKLFNTITILLMITVILFAALYTTNATIPFETLPYLTSVILNFLFNKNT